MTEQLTEEDRRQPTRSIRLFVTQVREHLADLDVEERQELTVGLEADLTELVADRGSEALGEPADYARELRTAAGHAPATAAGPFGRSLRRALQETVDGAHAGWERLLGSVPGDLRGFAAALQPVWWVLRAWVAWMLAQDVRGPYVVVDGGWLVVLAIFVLVSVQIGRGVWRIDRLLVSSVTIRLLLVGLNVFAVMMLPGAVDRMSMYVAEERGHELGWGQEVATNSEVVTYRDQPACEIEVRDAGGRPIPGAYVWDATGSRRLPMSTTDC